MIRLATPLTIAGVASALSALALGPGVWPYVFGGVLVLLVRRR